MTHRPALPTLHHEHLIRINDPANTLGEWLTRTQLWEGLRHTVLAPQALDESIDLASVQEKSEGVWARRLCRGSAVSIDEVILVAEESLTIHADAQGAFSGSTLTLRIVEPAPEMLFVRFTYQLFGLEAGRTEEEDTARRSAYTASDTERIREARRYAVAKPS